ncbi:MAG: HIT family protein [Pseudomonadota bacterium]
MPDFTLHAQLTRDTHSIGSFALCQVLLMDDALYPWLILVPQRAGIREIYQLSAPEQALLMQESSFLAQRLAQFFNADKINIAALGNVVPQLHLHHIVRYQTDSAWPAPVWGAHARVPYAPGQAVARVGELKPLLQPMLLSC